MTNLGIFFQALLEATTGAVFIISIFIFTDIIVKTKKEKIKRRRDGR